MRLKLFWLRTGIAGLPDLAFIFCKYLICIWWGAAVIFLRFSCNTSVIPFVSISVCIRTMVSCTRTVRGISRSLVQASVNTRFIAGFSSAFVHSNEALRRQWMYLDDAFVAPEDTPETQLILRTRIDRKGLIVA